MDLGEKEAADYYKYLRLPQVKILSREEKVSAVSDVLKEHPEYLFYIFDENEYRDLEKWLRYQQGIVFQRPKSKNMLIKLLLPASCTTPPAFNCYNISHIFFIHKGIIHHI